MRYAVVATLFAAATGCYSLHPVANQSILPGSTLNLSINDAGRAALGGAMGPEISDIEGRLISRDSGEFVLAVTDVKLLRGGQQVWSGEKVRINSSYISVVSEKRFSRGKTALISGASAALLVGIFSQAIKGSLAGSDGKLPSDTGLSIRYPRFGR